MVGRRLLHYEITEKLGEGGMGVVYKARDTHLERFVAIKVLPPERTADPRRKSRFVQEAKSASALNHPNIVVVHDVSSESGSDFIVMEYVAGKTLEQLIRRKPLPLRETLKYGIQIADALSHAHSAGIVHRDLKPSNVMVDEHGLVKVLDFGLAKLTEVVTGEEAATQTLRPTTEEGTVVGTAAYMSPEQAEGKHVDARSDIFSFGALLYEMASGRRAFSGDSRVKTLSAVLHNEPPPLPDDSSPELLRVIMRCLRKDVERRFQHMDDVKIALQDLKDESDSGVLRPDQTSRKSVSRWVSVAVLGGALAIVGIGAWLWRSSTRVPATPALLDALPLTTYPGSESGPTFSPDGTQLAFSGCRGGDCHIYIKQAGIEEPYRLTNDQGRDYAPEWSPDGAFIAFARFAHDPTLPRFQYVLIPQRGGKEKILAEFTFPLNFVNLHFPHRMLSWCPDSKWLVVSSGESRPDSGLYLIPTTGGEPRKLTDAGGTGSVDLNPAVSPDGRWLAFTHHPSAFESTLMIARLSPDHAVQGAPRRMAAPGQLKSFPAWTPDSHELLFAAGDLDKGALFRVAPEQGSPPAQVAVVGYDHGAFAISRQGRLAFTKWTGNAQLWRMSAKQRDGPWGAPQLFSSSRENEFVPSYSPRGDKVTFASNRSGRTEIWVSDQDGTNLTQLTFLNGFANRPRWSPDGRWIAFYATVESNCDVYVIAAGGGAAKRVTVDPAKDMNPEWSCRGEYIYFVSDRKPPEPAWRVPVTGGDATPRGSAGLLDSPDCERVFYETGWPDQFAVWRKPAGAGQAVVAAESLHPTGGWQAFPDAIYYVGKPSRDGRSPILIRDFRTGRIRQLGSIPPSPFWGLTVSPDRRTILFASREPQQGDLMLVDHFR